ncbi:hypothetical protein RhiirA1_461917 [Rhizophagus irregularis]|uniref:Bromo domain-containing protein n=1 Tax=Rhizophagus irregularis TaxID=588596 RepID=A0A2N0RNB3_9GLOM|nr:hypothetical protein RhiirA1_461917 [Rhizophagus irregularis]
MNTFESYFGQNAIISYIRKQKNKASYWGFLNNYHKIIVTSIFSDNTTFSDDWNELNNTWIAHFINEGKIIPVLKIRLLDSGALTLLFYLSACSGGGTGYIITEQLRYSTKLQTFWQEIIKKYKKEKENQVSSHQEEYEKEKENQVSAIASHSKRIIKIPVKDKNINSLISEISNKIIKNPMDLFTIILKLEHDQYTNTEEFEKDIRLIFCNCYIYNDVGSEMHTLGEALESAFNKIWTEKIVSQVKQKEKLKRAQDNNSDASARDNNSDSSGFITKQIQILEQNKDKLVYRQVVNDATLIVSAYENTVSGNIIPFIEILKTFLSTRSQMSLFSADEPVLQAIVESLLPLKYCIPELSLVMDGTKPKGFGRFGYSDIFILKGIGNNNVNKIIEKEDEKVLLKRLYTYWSKEHNETRQTTIEDILNNGVYQLKSYMNIISKGKTIDYYSSGIFDKRIKITKSNSNKLEGFVILVIGFQLLLNISVNKGCIASGINRIFTQLPTGFLLNTTYPGIPVLFKNQQGKQLQNTINDST